MSDSVPTFIALGSNLGQPSRQLHLALGALASLADTELIKVSSFYRSSPVGPGDQPDYLNAVALLLTQLPAQVLLQKLQAIETAQGRTRDVRWGPRTLDLDILLYGNDRIDTPHLSIPHPRMYERDFVLYPLREISDTETPLPDGADLDRLIAQLPATDITITRDKHPLQINEQASNNTAINKIRPAGSSD